MYAPRLAASRVAKNAHKFPDIVLLPTGLVRVIAAWYPSQWIPLLSARAGVEHTMVVVGPMGRFSKGALFLRPLLDDGS